jgi:hypothetical protein
MPVQVILDTLQGSALDASLARQSRVIRGGIVTGVDMAPDTNAGDPEALFKLRNAIGIPYGSPISATYPTYTLQRIFIVGIEPGGARFQLIYETPDFSGLPPSTYILGDSATLQTVNNVNLLPRIKTLLRVAGITTTAGKWVEGRKASLTYTQPLRVVSVSALLFGQPVDNQDVVGKVNLGFWRNKPQGYWKVFAYETRQSKYSGYWTMEAAAATKGNEDWSDVEMLFMPATGDLVEPASGDVTFAANAPYNFGIIVNSPGILKVGLYELANLNTAFGVT